MLSAQMGILVLVRVSILRPENNNSQNTDYYLGGRNINQFWQGCLIYDVYKISITMLSDL